MANNKDKYKIDCFLAGPVRNADMKAWAEITKSILVEFRDGLQVHAVLKGFHYRPKRGLGHVHLVVTGDLSPPV